MILLDTSILIDYFRGQKEANTFINHHGKSTLALNSLVVMELFRGARNKQELQKIKKELNGIRLLPLNQAIATLATQIIDSMGLAYNISIPDALIAVTALVYDVELRTLNVKDFRPIPSLRVSNELKI